MIDLKKKIHDDSDKIDPHLIGSLMYLVNTRLDTCHAVNVLSHESTKTDNSKTCIEIYIQGIVRYGLRYDSSENLSLQDMSIQIE
jgi:hypothetical protein